jgi:hypothetical protein
VAATDFTQEIDILQNVCEEVNHVTLKNKTFL